MIFMSGNVSYFDAARTFTHILFMFSLAYRDRCVAQQFLPMQNSH